MVAAEKTFGKLAAAVWMLEGSIDTSFNSEDGYTVHVKTPSFERWSTAYSLGEALSLMRECLSNEATRMQGVASDLDGLAVVIATGEYDGPFKINTRVYKEPDGSCHRIKGFAWVRGERCARLSSHDDPVPLSVLQVDPFDIGEEVPR